MKFIINPLNGTKHSLFSKQGKNLLKSYVKTYQTGGQVDQLTDSDYDYDYFGDNDQYIQEDPSINIDSSKLHILGCIGEILQFDEAENKTGRMIDGKSTKPIALLSEQCSHKTLSKEGKYPLMSDSTRNHLKKTCDDSTQGGVLVYHPHKGICLNADAGLGDRNASKLKKQIWNDISASILNILKGLKNRENAHVVIVSHHNLIKKILLGMDKSKNGKKLGIANCACIKITIKKKESEEVVVPDYQSIRAPSQTQQNKAAIIEYNLIYEGFPDKVGKYEYVKKQTFNKQDIKQDKIIANAFRDPQFPKEFHILLVRHGNAMHNKPVMDMLQEKNLGYRPLDSSLTLIGLWQAEQLGKDLKKYFKNQRNRQIVYCASNLARAQTTALAIKGQVDEFNVNDEPLKMYYEQKKRASIERMTRRLKIKNLDDVNDVIKKLAENLGKMLENKSDSEKSVEDFKSMAEDMLGGFVFSQTAQELKEKQRQKREKGESQLERQIEQEQKKFTKGRLDLYKDVDAAEEADKLIRSEDNDGDDDDGDDDDGDDDDGDFLLTDSTDSSDEE